MKFTKIALDNFQFTIIMFVMLVVVGIVSFLTMPRSEDPQVSPAGSSIVVVYPGASPEDLETLVVDPLEEAINELDDIYKFNSTIQDGLAIIRVEFFSGSDPDDKYSDVLQKVNRTREVLPEEILNLEVIKFSISNVNIFQVALVSDSAEYALLEKKAEELKKTLELVPGIKKVETFAFPEQVVDVSVDIEKAAMMHIPLQQIIGAIQSNNLNIPGGPLDIGHKKFNIKTSGFYERIEDIQNTVIHARQGTPVLLKDVADIKMGYADKKYYARFNDRRAVFIAGPQKEATNIFDIMDEVKAELVVFKAGLPQDIELEMVFDQSESVSSRITQFFLNLLQGILLVGFVIFIVFGFRESVIIAIAIPLSILIAIGFVDLSNYGLEQMSIVALVIALGLLVDNAIVITENMTRFIKAGHSLYESALKATSQVGWAIISSTVTTVMAFVPMIMIQNTTGDFIRSMPVTVVYTLTASLLVALTITPFLATKILKENASFHSQQITVWIDGFISQHYRTILAGALKKPWIPLVVSFAVFLGSVIFIFPMVGVSFFPMAEKPQFLINIETPQGSNLDFTDKVARDVESELKKHTDVKHYATNIGRSNPQIYYNVWVRYETANFAQIFVEITENDLQLFKQVTSELRDTFKDYPGAKIEVKEFAQGPPVDAPISIKVIGNNLETLKQLAADVEEIILNEPGTINLSNPLGTSSTDLHVNINRSKAAMLGIPISTIDFTVRAALTGAEVSQYQDDEGETHDIVVRLPVENKPAINDLKKIYLPTATGALVSLEQVARIEFKESPTAISHFKMQRNANVTADVLPDFSVTDATNNIVAKLEKKAWPEGYRFEISGEQESRQESFGGLGQAVIISLLSIFGVLVLQFRSFVQPFIIFAALPLAIIGSILALFVVGLSFSFTAFIGLTSLIGIVINNSIILVDFTNQLRRDGLELLDALKQAAETRFLPIILTTATTVAGLLPLTLAGGTLWAPLGWTIIGGLLVSTFLTLIVVPVLYSLVAK